MQIKAKAFTHELKYSAICQAVLPLGVAMYNELGRFTLIELNNPFSQ